MSTVYLSMVYLFKMGCGSEMKGVKSRLVNIIYNKAFFWDTPFLLLDESPLTIDAA